MRRGKRRAEDAAGATAGKEPRPADDLAALQSSLPLDPIAGCYFPFYVMPKAAFLKLDRLVPHEVARERGLLARFAPDNRDGEVSNPFWKLRCDATGRPTAEAVEFFRFCFFSHRWLSPSRDPALAHPDDGSNTKCRAMQRFLRRKPEVEFVWLDFFSVARLPLLA